MAAPEGLKSYPSIEELSTNSLESFLDASDILLKFANNILNNVEVEKYRQIRLSNPVVESRLLQVSGAMECLFEMGFEEDGEYLRYPKGKLLDDLASFRDQLLVERQKKLRSGGGSTQQSDVLPSLPAPPARTATSESGRQKVDMAARMSLLVSEQTFFHKLQSNLLHVLMYEDSALQNRARQLIPIEEFVKTATQKSRETSSGENPVGMNDFMLLELLNWFKTKFFTWVDSPQCSTCSKVSERRGMLEPTMEDKKWGANRVEGYYCNHCRKEVRFPRYNHPGKLLETRRGRCGEWANCFTLCCRALGFEARYVVDWTDHVWTEVYSDSQSRWLHCDPCENACDKPLMYEVGWGKSLSYVIAFSKDDIKDVTWRYTRDVDQILKRRKECREDWLVDTIVKLRERKQSSLSEGRKTELKSRALSEFCELLTTKKEDGDYKGRQSGSLAWRLARGEAGCKPKPDPYVIKPSEEDLRAGFVRVRYNCASDQYVRSGGGSTISGWEKAVFEYDNVQRKQELDWGMVYLARTEGSERASIKWKFDFSDCEAAVDRVTIRCESSVFHDGKVQWRLCGKDACVPIFGDRLETSDLAGEKCLVLKADLTLGTGDSAWQHTQLFRQKSSDTDSWPLDISISFK